MRCMEGYCHYPKYPLPEGRRRFFSRTVMSPAYSHYAVITLDINLSYKDYF